MMSTQEIKYVWVSKERTSFSALTAIGAPTRSRTQAPMLQEHILKCPHNITSCRQGSIAGKELRVLGIFVGNWQC